MSNTPFDVAGLSGIDQPLVRNNDVDKVAAKAAALDFESRLVDGAASGSVFVNAASLSEAVPLQGFPNASVIADAES